MKSKNEQPDLPFVEDLESEKPVGNGFVDRPYRRNARLTPRSEGEKIITAEKMEVAGNTGENLVKEALRSLGYDLEIASNGNPDFVDKDSGYFFEVKTVNSQRPFDIPRSQFDKFIEMTERGERVFYVFISYHNKKINSGPWSKESAGMSPEAYEDFVIRGVSSVVVVDIRLLVPFSIGSNRSRDMDAGEKTVHIPRSWLSLRESNDDIEVNLSS